jgi:hypothetical protein
MPIYPVTVTASYAAAGAPGDTVERLRAWAAASDGRTFAVDDAIAPVRWTATVDYEIWADTGNGFKTLAEGAKVSYVSESGPKGPSATQVTLV